MYRNGLFLIAKRPVGKHLAGYWEFPGGKIQDGESSPECLRRELAEELGIHVSVGPLFLEHTHEYADRTVHLLTYLVSAHEDPEPKEHEALAWVTAQELLECQLSPADIAVAKKLLNTPKTALENQS